ncbi:MAG: HD domain-containing protein [Bacteroidales bacterium]|nr:HD domain-containing protein [Bacteroidales bacterium]
MLSPISNLIEAFTINLQNSYIELFGHQKLNYLLVINTLSEQALQTIALSNAPYHDVHHTMMVTEVGKEILKSKMLCEKKLTEYEWTHFIIAALYHDIGYIRGLCAGDKNGEYVKNQMGETVKISVQASDAILAPYHVDRAKIFAKNALRRYNFIDVSYIEQLIERTRFPVPQNSEYKITNDLPGLLRAADLIGQLADIHYLTKSDDLYQELKENGAADFFGYSESKDIKYKLPDFFNTNVRPYITDALSYLGKTKSGQEWVYNLFSNIKKVNFKQTI